MTDPISDMLTQIRNTLAVNRPEVVLSHSKLKENLARLLESQGFIEGLQVAEGQNQASQPAGRRFLKLQLKYGPTGLPAISGLKRLSKPGQRIYARAKELPRLSTGLGAIIISTSKGLMTDKKARKEKLGGEVICQVW